MYIPEVRPVAGLLYESEILSSISRENPPILIFRLLPSEFSLLGSQGVASKQRALHRV
jgi:hypothetical protein